MIRRGNRGRLTSGGTSRIAMGVAAVAFWLSSWAWAGNGLLPNEGGGVYTLQVVTSAEVDGNPLLQMRADLEVHALEAGKWRVRLLGASQVDVTTYEWSDMLIDSVDPRTDDLAEGVELEFIVDGPPDMQTLFPSDIPTPAFGLLLEVASILAMCSEVSGLDQMNTPGDETEFAGFQLAWSRPYASPANRRSLLPGSAQFVALEDGEAVVEIRPEGALWSTIYGYAHDMRLSVGVEELSVELRFDAASGALLRAEVPWSNLQIRPIGKVNSAILPERGEIDIPPDAQTYVTRRRIVLERAGASPD